MNNEFLKGILDAKISRLLTESDYLTFANLPGKDQLSFFINNNLVSTSIVSNFEALCKYAMHDLQKEITGYLPHKQIYVQYFFMNEFLTRKVGIKKETYNRLYKTALRNKDEYLLRHMDMKHSILNVMYILRAKKRGDKSETILKNFLEQNIMSEEVYASLVASESSVIHAYVKSQFNVDISPEDTNLQIEKKLDAYIDMKTKELAIESDLAPTLIYYITSKQAEILRLREIYYAKEHANG